MPIYEDKSFKDYVNSLPAATENDLAAGNNFPLVRDENLKKAAANIVESSFFSANLKEAVFGEYSYVLEATSSGHKAFAFKVHRGVKYRIISPSVDISAIYALDANDARTSHRIATLYSGGIVKGNLAEFVSSINADFISIYFREAGSVKLAAVGVLDGVTAPGELAYKGFEKTLSSSARGWVIFEQNLVAGHTYVFTNNSVSDGIGTVCSVDNNVYADSSHRIDVFSLGVVRGQSVEIIPTTSAKYLAVYFGGSGDASLQHEHTILSCERAIERAIGTFDDRIDVLKKSQVDIKGSVTPSSNNTESIYGISGISLKKGRTYSMGFCVSSNAANNDYITIKITNNDGSTYKQLGAYMSDQYPTLVSGEMYFTDFTATEDVENVKIGSYTKGIVKGGVEFTFFCLDVTYEINRFEDLDATNAIAYYPRYYSAEIAQLKKDSDVVFAIVSDLHRAYINFQRVVNVAEAVGADGVINCGDSVGNLNTEGLDWYNTIVNGSSIPVLTILGNHDCWTSSSPWVWSSAEANYNLIMPTLIAQAGVSETSGKCYWYKDFGALRVIGLDGIDYNMDNAHHWDVEQSNWFSSLLDDSRTNNKKVLILNHYPFDKSKVSVADKGWNSWDTYLDSYRQWDTLYTPESAAALVKGFIDAGGVFVGWVVGHTHSDSTLQRTDDSRQLMLVTASGSFQKHPDSASYSSVKDRRYDCFNLVGIDLTHGLMKILRCGLDEDSAMQIRKPFTWDYVNCRILGGKE